MASKKGTAGFMGPLMYKGMPVLFDPEMANNEVWFVNKNNFIVEKVKQGTKLTCLQRVWIYIRTIYSEIIGKGATGPVHIVNWHELPGPRQYSKNIKQTKNGTLTIEKMGELYRKAKKYGN